jgi:hypothetical protein
MREPPASTSVSISISLGLRTGSCLSLVPKLLIVVAEFATERGFYPSSLSEEPQQSFQSRALLIFTVNCSTGTA